MIELTHLLKTFGTHSIELIWFPLLVWTVLAVPVAFLLHRADSIPPLYQYHSRVALLLSLPLGVTTSYFVDLIASSSQPAEIATAFFVVQNPITITAPSAESAAMPGLGDPAIWFGVLSFLLLAGAIYSLLKMSFSLLHLKKLEANLMFEPLSDIAEIENRLPENENLEKPAVAFSTEAKVPFTYGWLQTKIVIPEELQNNPEELAMAIQHELMHIKHRDFLLNGLLIVVKSLFWIHPLAHYLYKTSHEYREIVCDGEVLASKKFSKKRYAALLFNLAQKEHQLSLAKNMAVNPSSLKKRINIMSKQTLTSTKFRSSFFVTFVSAALIVIAMACSDMQDNGITNTEVENAQAQIAERPTSSQLLYVINGEKWTGDKFDKDKLSRIKTKYIDQINILKGKKGIQKYGDAGKNGVIEMDLNNPEKALSDLKSKVTPGKKAQDEEFYVAVEEMPKLVGGLASLQKKMTYPEEARRAGLEGRVIVQFIVDEKGNVINPSVIKGDYESLNEEALRVVKQATFEPGKQNGKPVRVQYSLPITYKLPSDDKG